MLVLTRRLSQFVRVKVPPSNEPQEILVALVELTSSQARVGFVADRGIEISRSVPGQTLDQEPAFVAQRLARLQ